MSTYETNRYAFPASAIASGTLADARIPNLATAKITSGTFADARLSSSSVTQHVDLSNLNASNLTSGSIPNARVPSGAVTQHVSATTQATGTWTLGVTDGGITIQNAHYIRVGNIVSATVWAKGTSAPTYDTTPFAFTGLPITPLNTGDATDCVGWGVYGGKGATETPLVWVLSNNTNIYIGRSGDWYDANHHKLGD